MKTRKSGWTNKRSGKKYQAVRGTLEYNSRVVYQACDVWLKKKGLV